MNVNVDAANSGLVAFISHSHIDREFAGETKEVLSDFGVEAFVAHDDIKVSEKWKRRIRKELRRCHLFVPLLSENFMQSEWALQEVGFIASRSKVKIFPLSIDETVPFGFISHLQSGHIHDSRITREDLMDPLVEHFPREILPSLIRRVGNAHSFRDAESKMRSIVPFFQILTKTEAQDLAEAAAKNGQVWDAQSCRDKYLPEFIRIHKGNVKVKTLHALRYQMRTGTWYIPE